MKNTKNNNYHFYTFPEIMGQLFVLVVLVSAITGLFRLTDHLITDQQPAIAQTMINEQIITSVGDHLNEGYLQYQTTPLIEPAHLPVVRDKIVI
ncbi:MAG: hypothetical protein V1838_03530 [Patescibacteria group bacterium]